MHVIWKFLLVPLTIITVLGIIGTLIPSGLTTSINDAFLYFLNFLNYLNFIIHVDVLFTVLKYGVNLLLGMALVTLVIGITHLIFKS